MRYFVRVTPERVDGAPGYVVAIQPENTLPDEGVMRVVVPHEGLEALAAALRAITALDGVDLGLGLNDLTFWTGVR